jgi:hypothetical protein
MTETMVSSTTWMLGLMTLTVACFCVLGEFIGFKEGVRYVDSVTILCIFFVGTMLSSKTDKMVSR